MHFLLTIMYTTNNPCSILTFQLRVLAKVHYANLRCCQECLSNLNRGQFLWGWSNLRPHVLNNTIWKKGHGMLRNKLQFKRSLCITFSWVTNVKHYISNIIILMWILEDSPFVFHEAWEWKSACPPATLTGFSWTIVVRGEVTTLEDLEGWIARNTKPTARVFPALCAVNLHQENHWLWKESTCCSRQLACEAYLSLIATQR